MLTRLDIVICMYNPVEECQSAEPFTVPMTLQLYKAALGFAIRPLFVGGGTQSLDEHASSFSAVYLNSSMVDHAVLAIPVPRQEGNTTTLIDFGTEIAILWKIAGSACRSCFMDIYDMSKS